MLQVIVHICELIILVPIASLVVIGVVSFIVDFCKRGL